MSDIEIIYYGNRDYISKNIESLVFYEMHNLRGNEVFEAKLFRSSAIGKSLGNYFEIDDFMEMHLIAW